LEAAVSAFDRPYIISWNLTYRCNLACEHCYLDAGAEKERKDTSLAFEDRSELSTPEVFKIIDDISEFAPEAVVILTGGEPLLRRDILEIISYGNQKNLWIVVGSNGVMITESLAKTLKESGVRGMALSLDALNPHVHDLFRKVSGAFNNTVQGAQVLHQAELPFIVQTTVGKHNIDQLNEIAQFAYEKMQAKVFNLYFLVPSGRGQYISDISATEYNRVLEEISVIQENYDGKMMVNAKCAPHYSRHLFEHKPDSKFLKNFTGNAGGCPAGTQYMGIRPNGDMTPCPYLPQFGGNLKTQSLKTIWETSALFQNIRKRDQLADRCGQCEFSNTCGGCRARAFTTFGSVLAEDLLCDYQPGKYNFKKISFNQGIEYGLKQNLPNSSAESITWELSAQQRMKQIPAFVRGMVTKSVEKYCLKNNISHVDEQTLNLIRSKMPTSKIFKSPSSFK